MHESASGRVHRVLAGIMVALLGAVEGVFGRTQYMGDWISYLNVSRAIPAHNWKEVFNPMWSLGYPALIALARWFAPATPVGEWYAICVLNWIIFIATYAALRFLVNELATISEGTAEEAPFASWSTWTIGLLFLGSELCIDRVSRVSPDMLVTLLLLLAIAFAIRVIRQRNMGNAALLGVILGIGCCVKGVFVGYAAIVLFLMVVLTLKRKLNWRPIAVSTGLLLVVFTPFVCGISWSEGRFTLGVTGELNYAYYVNFLPHWTHWQGDSAGFGMPVHRSQKLLEDLPVFGFAEPFHTTYPPYNNLAYWYVGYRHFFSVKNQLMAIVRDSYISATIVKGHPLLVAIVLVWVGVLLIPAWRWVCTDALSRYWLLLAFPCLAFLPYLMVHVEDRYLAGIALILALFPIALASLARSRGTAGLLTFVFVVYGLGSIAELVHENSWLVSAAFHRTDFHENSQWKLGTELSEYGVEAGAPVALVASKDLSIRCTWAYIANVRIVSEFGELPWRVEPPYRWPPHHGKPEEADQDWGRTFWHLSAQDQERVLASFESTGAVAAISLTPPDSAAGGWREVGDSGAWIYNFQPKESPRTVAGNRAFSGE